MSKFYYCGSLEKQVGVVGCTVLILHITPPTCNHTPVYVDVGSKKGESSLAHIIHGPCLNGYSVSHRLEQGTDMGVYTQSQSVMNSFGSYYCYRGKTTPIKSGTNTNYLGERCGTWNLRRHIHMTYCDDLMDVHAL